MLLLIIFQHFRTLTPHQYKIGDTYQYLYSKLLYLKGVNKNIQRSEHLLQIPIFRLINLIINHQISIGLQVTSSQMLNTNIKLKDNKQDIYEENSISLVEGTHTGFKLFRCCKSLFQKEFCKEFFKFLMLALLTVIMLVTLFKLQSNITYSIQSTETYGSNSILRKDIPGIFPPLSSYKSEIIGKWMVKVISSQTGPTNLTFLNYQMQFKHAQKKTDIAYLTKGNCSGDIKMNWSTYGNNMYLTKYTSTDSSMTIPNLAKDEQCIKSGTQKFPKLIQYATVWTVFQEDSKTSLFLLIQQPQKDELRSQRRSKNNHVLILEKISK